MNKYAHRSVKYIVFTLTKFTHKFFFFSLSDVLIMDKLYVGNLSRHRSTNRQSCFISFNLTVITLTHVFFRRCDAAPSNLRWGGEAWGAGCGITLVLPGTNVWLAHCTLLGTLTHELPRWCLWYELLPRKSFSNPSDSFTFPLSKAFKESKPRRACCSKDAQLLNKNIFW